MSDHPRYSGLEQLGAKTEAPETPEAAELERVSNPHPDTLYCARFVAPEFTSLCPVTGQPDFAHIVIDRKSLTPRRIFRIRMNTIGELPMFSVAYRICRKTILLRGERTKRGIKLNEPVSQNCSDIGALLKGVSE